MLLDDRRIVVTGVATKQSIAYAIAERAQRLGAELVLTSFGRAKRLTERAARSLPEPVDVLELDVTNSEDLARLRAGLTSRWGRVDGIVHSVAFAPQDALGGDFLGTPSASAELAFRISAFSLKELVAGLLPLLCKSDGASVVGLDFDATVAWPAYDWMGVSKAALEAVARYLARDIGAERARVNLLAAGPLNTVAASGVPGFGELVQEWSARAPLGWNPDDGAPVADAACFLLSALSRGVTAEVLHVDGGFHAMGAPLRRPENDDREKENLTSPGRSFELPRMGVTQVR